MKKRVGIIEINKDLVERVSSNPDSCLYSVFANFIPIDVRHNLEHNCIEYFGTSPLFDEIHEGDMAPRYTVVIQNHAIPAPGMNRRVVVSTFEKFVRLDR